MKAMRPSRIMVVLAATNVALLSVLVPLGQPWRVVAVLAFVLCVPGLALKPFVSIGDRLTTTIMVVATSIGLTCLVSQALAIAHSWSALRVLIVLGGLSLASALLPERRTP